MRGVEAVLIPRGGVLISPVALTAQVLRVWRRAAAQPRRHAGRARRARSQRGRRRCTCRRCSWKQEVKEGCVAPPLGSGIDAHGNRTPYLADFREEGEASCSRG